MKTLIVFFMLSIPAFSAPPGPPNATELKVRQIWADYYKKKGYDFDIQKMSASDMEKDFHKAEREKKLQQLENSPPETDAHAAARSKESAESGQLLGMAELAGCYYRGRGIPRDYLKAVEWAKKAVNDAESTPDINLGPMGIWDCYATLGCCYYSGNGVAKDLVRAAEYFKKAADEGDGYCQYRIGLCYSKGFGVAKDDILGYMWLNLSAVGGDKDAAVARETLAHKMTSDQISQAQRLSSQWKPTAAAAKTQKMVRGFLGDP
jgi:TPR repeat protein